MDRIRDRGNIKWAGLMLPEHVIALRKHAEMENYIERPYLDDWELEAIQMEIEIAYKSGSNISVSTWCKGRINPYNGKILKLDHRLNLISIEGPFGDERIPVADVIRADLMEY
ncbi:YolD-like family protein [Sporosarcina psychrophila]|uniref:YolD-like family protein n=1 Tax=Sporosarcina psychrophila TaxID=1476 RepID=UPI00078B3C4F|nr:YolD-like family protein [Sporosarcina psychrophila]AMQ06712.1 hypothetical protein AZE41_12650 [Sporosarcina psychrophila]